MLLKMEEICQHDSVSNRLVKLQLKMARCTHCTIVIILQKKKIYIYICSGSTIKKNLPIMDNKQNRNVSVI